MNDWKVIPTIVFATVLIFSAGVFTGGLLVDHVQKARSKPPHKAAPTTDSHSITNLVATNPPVMTNDVSKLRPPEILNKRFLQQLDSQLNLQPAQRDAIQKIIEDGQNLMRKTVQDARLEIRDVLTPEQRVQFDELVKRPFHRPIFGTNAPSGVMPTNAAPAAP